MPRVNTYPIAEISQRGISTPGYSDASARIAANSGIGEGMQDLGRGLGAVSDASAQISLRIQEQDNTTEAKNLDLGLSQELQRLTTDYVSKRGGDAIGAYEKYKQDIDKARTTFKGKASNSAVSNMFDTVADGRYNLALSDMDRHVVGERTAYQDGIDDATVVDAQNNGAATWSDPKRFMVEYNRGLASVQSKALRTGQPPEMTKLAMDQYRSGFFANVVARSMAESPATSRAVFGKYSSQLNAEDYGKLYTAMVRNDDIYATAAAADQIYGEAGAMVLGGHSAGAYYQKVIGTESGGDPNARSSTSSAAGLAGFTKGTWKQVWSEVAPGQEPPPINNPEAQAAALKYLTRKNAIELFKGLDHEPSDTEVYLAHHFGAAGALRILKAGIDAPLSDVVSPEAMEANPQLAGLSVGELIMNTQAKFGNGQTWKGEAADRTPADPVAALEAAKAIAVRRTYEIEDPERRKAVQDQVEGKYDADIDQAKAAQKEATAGVWKALVGGNRISDLAPEQIAAIEPTTFKNMQEYDAKKDVVKTDINRREALQHLRYADPAGFATIRAADVSKYLDKSDMGWFLGEQEKIQSGQAVDQGREALAKMIDQSAQFDLGYKLSDLKDDPGSDKGQDYINFVRRANEVYSLQTAGGKTLTSTEMQQMLRGLTTKITLEETQARFKVPTYRGMATVTADLPPVDEFGYQLTTRDIPKLMLPAIDDAIRRSGDQVSDLTRLQYFMGYLSNKQRQVRSQQADQEQQ
jgi:hypothetical protein